MIAVIGGTGLTEPRFLKDVQVRQVSTPYDKQSVQLLIGSLNDGEVAFLPRHGPEHKLPPHKINYRANLWALQRLGVTAVIGINAVGGIHQETGPGRLIVPNQIIDYTWGREHTFFSDGLDAVTHIDFTHPYDMALRSLLIDSAEGHTIRAEGVYGCTQGPRLESAAEVQRLLRDGCDMIGMTGMPEAALARELGIAYACLALSVNWAAGLSEELITMDAIKKVLTTGMEEVIAVVCKTITRYNATEV
jgi:5'-methylthioinosine phosphorylase